MITVRKAADRGGFDHGWLDTKHTFSFSGYYDPRFMGYRSLRVINEDWVKPSRGFGMHGHKDMEIVTYIVSGALEHKDSLGSGSIITPGEVQRMSAGTGVRHSEFNPSRDETAHLLQIWIEPAEENLTPSYEQKRFAIHGDTGKLHVLASGDRSEPGPVHINQDARILGGVLEREQTVSYRLGAGRGAWVQVVSGSFDVEGQRLEMGDGAAIENVDVLTLTSVDTGEVLLFDLA